MDSASLPVCYLTTVGRTSGQPHRIEIWFLPCGQDVYLLSGNGTSADWVRNLRASSGVVLELPGQRPTPYVGLVLDGAEGAAPEIRQAMDARYQGWTPGSPLSGWAKASTVVRLRPHQATDGAGDGMRASRIGGRCPDVA